MHFHAAGFVVRVLRLCVCVGVWRRWDEAVGGGWQVAFVANFDVVSFHHIRHCCRNYALSTLVVAANHIFTSGNFSGLKCGIKSSDGCNPSRLPCLLYTICSSPYPVL